jgi:hypothetical protein
MGGNDLSIRREFDGAVVFLTGVTGFVGGMLLEQLLRCTSVSWSCEKAARTVEEKRERPTPSGCFFFFPSFAPALPSGSLVVSGARR